jgi:hypothetical protein
MVRYSRVSKGLRCTALTRSRGRDMLALHLLLKPLLAWAREVV